MPYSRFFQNTIALALAREDRQRSSKSLFYLARQHTKLCSYSFLAGSSWIRTVFKRQLNH